GRTAGAGTGAGLGDVAPVDRRAADCTRIARRVLARVAGAVALVHRARVAVRRAGRPERLLDVGRARGARARAGLHRVALARGRAAGGPRVARRVLAGGARAVALIHGARVAVVGAGGAARLEDVGGAGRAGAGAGLGDVAPVDRRAADCGRARVQRVLAVDARAVALVERAGVAVVGTCGPVRLPGASVCRTRSARARAGLGKITLPGSGATDGARVAHRVLAGGASAVALVQGAGISIVRAGGACADEGAVVLAA